MKYRTLFLVLLLNVLFLNSIHCAVGQQPINKAGVTTVTASIFVIDIEDINSADQNFKANVFYRFSWKDPTLAHSGDKAIRKPLGDIWNPNILIVNQQKIWKTFPDTVSISPSGDVTVLPKGLGFFFSAPQLINVPL